MMIVKHGNQYMLYECNGCGCKFFEVRANKCPECYDTRLKVIGNCLEMTESLEDRIADLEENVDTLFNSIPKMYEF